MEKTNKIEVPTTIQEIYDADRQVTRAIPATFVTAFLIETGGPTIRITFGEGRADVKELVRMAIVMPVDDAWALSRKLAAALAKAEAEAKAAEDATAPVEPPKEGVQ